MNGPARLQIVLATSLAAIIGGALVYLMPERAREPSGQAEAMPRPGPAMPAYAGELHERFQQAAVMLHAGQAEHALVALERVIGLAPGLPEARVNAGFALFELSDLEGARTQFQTAIDLRPRQVNAYYGLALTLEALGDLDGALGAMRTYVHLADGQDTLLRRAQAAIWEWQAQREQRLAGQGVHAEAVAGGASAAAQGGGG